VQGVHAGHGEVEQEEELRLPSRASIVGLEPPSANRSTGPAATLRLLISP
jgi:hypothetical protein